ncbi:MAG: Ku protein [Pyrinomonadaceae bacterium]|nr:Ku protein [Phycisphaerales bacterium]
MRPLWKGHISFGLVMIPVSLFSGEAPQSQLDLDMLDEKDHARIKLLRVNENTKKEVAWKSIVKGYEYEDGKYVVLDKKDFEAAASSVTKGVELLDCVKLDQVSPVYFEKPYYLEPAKGGEKGYVLLRDVLKRSGRIGIAKTVLQSRPHLAALIPQDNVLTLLTMRYPAQVRDPGDLHIPKSGGSASKPTPREMDMAEQLVEGMATDWDPSRYHDEYREALDKVIKDKVGSRGKKRKAAVEEVDELPPTYNIMDLLRKSVEGRSSAKPRVRAKAPAKQSRSSGTAKRKAG